MRGSIVERNGHFAVVIELDKGPDGKRRQRWVSVKGDKDAAERKLTELLRQKDTGDYVQPTRLKVGQYLSEWLADYGKAKLSPRTLERYESIIRTHLNPAIGNLSLSQLRSTHIQAHYAALLKKGLAPRSVRYDHVVLHKALNTALKRGLVARNVADGVDVPQGRHVEMLTWDESEVATFLNAARDSEYYALFYTALFTGARRSELLALRWQDIDLLLGQVSVNRGLHHLRDGQYVFTQPKSARSRRTIALSPSATLTLKSHYDKTRMDLALLERTFSDDRLVFCTLEGKPLRPNTVSRAFTTLAVRAGVKRIRYHDARHTHASLMLKQGIHPKIIQERLGHSSIAITLDTYSHVAPGLQEAAAARFDDLVKIRHNKEASLADSLASHVLSSKNGLL